MDAFKLYIIVMLATYGCHALNCESGDGTEHYCDESCSDVPECYCSLTGYYYAAECSNPNNNLSRIPDKLSYNITMLKMYRTLLQTVGANDIAPYGYLRSIDLSQNELTTVQAGLLNGLPDMEEFLVHINKLTSLPFNLFTSLTELTTVRADFNRINSLPTFRDLINLIAINFQDNQITTIPSDIFVNCPKVLELNLANNKISNVPVDAFKGLTGLTDLDLTNNQISAVYSNSFRHLNSLANVYMYQNLLSSLPGDLFLASSQTLFNLDISFNRLSSIDNSAFASLPNLYAIHLGGNQLTSVPIAVNSLTSIATVNLRNNTFTTIGADSFSMLSTLEELFLDDMSTLTSVHIQAFRGLTALKRLSLGGNPGIKEFTPQHLQAMEHPIIEEIYLQGCGFTYLDELIFSDKPMLRYVDVYNNKLNCSCDLKWMPTVVSEEAPWAKHWAASSTPPTCFTPMHLRDWPIPSMLEADMTCDELVIERVSPQMQTAYLKMNINFTTHLYKGLPDSVWITPRQEVIVPGIPLDQHIYATHRILEDDNIIEAILFIDNTTEADQGTYRLLATNIVGNKTMDSTLQVIPYELTSPSPPETTGYVGGAMASAKHDGRNVLVLFFILLFLFF